MFKEVTCIIPTHNRPAFVWRLVLFFKDRAPDLRLIVLDSSREKGDLRRKLKDLNVNSIEYPSERLPINKIASGMEIVTTPYSFLCADDDFIFPSAVSKCVDFLKEHPDYSAAQGRFLSLVLNSRRGSPCEILWNPLYPKIRSIEQETPSNRLQAHLTELGGPTFYAIHRTDALREAFQVAKRCVDEWGLSELVPTAMTVICGKLKVLPLLYGARSSPEQSGGGPEGSHASQWYTAEKMERAVQCVGEKLSALQPTLDIQEAKKIVDQSLRAHIHLPQNKPIIKPDARPGFSRRMKDKLNWDHPFNLIRRIREFSFRFYPEGSAKRLAYDYRSWIEDPHALGYSEFQEMKKSIWKFYENSPNRETAIHY